MYEFEKENETLFISSDNRNHYLFEKNINFSIKKNHHCPNHILYKYSSIFIKLHTE